MLRPPINIRDLIHDSLFTCIPDPGNEAGLAIFEAALLKVDSGTSCFSKTFDFSPVFCGFGGIVLAFRGGDYARER